MSNFNNKAMGCSSPARSLKGNSPMKRKVSDSPIKFSETITPMPLETLTPMPLETLTPMPIIRDTSSPIIPMVEISKNEGHALSKSTPYSTTMNFYNIVEDPISGTAPSKIEESVIYKNEKNGETNIKGFAVNDDFISIDKTPNSGDLPEIIVKKMSSEISNQDLSMKCVFYQGNFLKGLIDGPVNFLNLAKKRVLFSQAR